MLRTTAASLAVLTLATVSTGCFYNSAWGARKTAQKNNAVLATPASLAPPPAEASHARAGDDAANDGGTTDGLTTLHVRVHASPAYSAQTPDWKSHVGQLLAQAGATLQASIGARLVVDSMDDWDRPAPARLDVELAALHVEDAGEKADLVLGLVGGLPMATRDFDQLGLGELGGKYLVVRAPNVAREYDDIEKAFDELSAETRARLRKERIRHREVAVLLHEIGHTLGAEHQKVDGSLMRAGYDPKMSGFDDESIARMKRRLARGPAPVVGVAGEASDAGAPVAAVATAPVDDTPPELRAEDRDVWRQAKDLLKAGDAKGAWAAAGPLFTSYPLVYGVLDLRCKLAMAYFGYFPDVKRECAPLMESTMKGAKKKERVNAHSK